MPELTPKLKVSIVGGGIVGLSQAVFLARQDKVDLHVFEAAAAFTEIGAGIGLGPNALAVYKEEGLYDAYLKIAFRNQGNNSFQLRFGDRKDGWEQVPYTVYSGEEGIAAAHRAELLALLVERLPKQGMYLGKHLSRYETSESGPIRLYFTDGTVAETDVLIGADGIKSCVRGVMYGQKGMTVEPQWSGTIAYRALVPMEELKSAVGEDLAMHPLCWMGRNRHLIVIPVQQGRTANLVVFVSDRSEGRNPKWTHKAWVEPQVPQEEMLSGFEDWAEPVKKTLQLIKKPSKWAIHELPQLPYFVDGRVALVGDAAHAMLPHHGNGASQGIEDAYVLAHLLSHPSVNLGNVAHALKAYEISRKERAQRVQESSYRSGLIYELVSPCGEDPDKIGKDLEARFDYIRNVDVKAELRTAIEAFEQGLS